MERESTLGRKLSYFRILIGTIYLKFEKIIIANSFK